MKQLCLNEELTSDLVIFLQRVKVEDCYVYNDKCNSCTARNLLRRIGDLEMTDAPAPQPHAPIVEVAEAVAQTIANPSPAIMFEDLIMIHNLVNELKAKLAGKHPSLLTVFYALFNA